MYAERLHGEAAGNTGTLALLKFVKTTCGEPGHFTDVLGSVAMGCAHRGLGQDNSQSLGARTSVNEGMPGSV